MIKKALFIVALAIVFQAQAQRTNSSPYSFFGIGEEFNSRTIEQNAMGGIGAAFNSTYNINLVNPAANAYLRYSTYTFGILNNDLTIKDSNGDQSSTSTNLSYLAFGVPFGNKAGLSFGIQPVSSVGYSLLNSTLDADDSLTELTQFTGNGGVNRIYGSMGAFLLKNLSVGFEASYLFGSIENNVANQRVGVFLASKNQEVLNIRGGMLKLGIQYKKELKDKLLLDVGAVFKLSNDFRATGNEYLYSLSFAASGGEIPRDTIYAASVKGKLKSPIQTILGVGLGKENKWYAGVEYEHQAALNPEGFLTQTGGAFDYDTSSRISVGGFYTPDMNSISSYWNRVIYRAGIRYENTGLLVSGSNSTNFTSIKDFGMSFGLGFPMGRKLSTVNLGFEFGKKGTTTDNLIQENYFNFRLGLSLNDLWFIKRKID